MAPNVLALTKAGERGGGRADACLATTAKLPLSPTPRGDRIPILDVEIVGETPEAARPGLARRLADAAGEALRSRPQGTWVKVRHLAEHDYAENACGRAAENVHVLYHAPGAGRIAFGGRLVE